MIVQGSPEWFAQRQGRITASRAAACLGLNPYQSPREAWRSITGKGGREGPPNEHMRRGVAWEATTRRRYQSLLIATGAFDLAGVVLAPDFQLVQPGGFWIHPGHDWLAASPDGLIGSVGACELKNPMKLATSCPMMYRIQCIVQMACTGRQWVDFFSWPPCNAQHYWERIARPTETALTSLVARLEAWHKEFILGDKEPPDGRSRAGREAACEAAEAAIKWGFADAV